ncbi:hypothetical protein ACPF4X_003364 [Vibrio cholerae]
MVSVVVVEFSVMRCQPLRRALAEWRIKGLDFESVEIALNSGDIQEIELMARAVLGNLTHQQVAKLSEHSVRFHSLLLSTDPNDKEYLALVYILGEYLKEVQNGKCACTIVNKSMFNCPERLSGILDILEQRFDSKTYTTWTHSKCRSCGSEYESERLPSGFGERVLWSKIS